jgi:DNA polymerase III alpha subunit (gram-positive type)
MKYISIDIETTGLDPEKNKIISVAAIIEDTENKLPFEQCPKFNVAVLQNELIGSARAITINKQLISDIADYQDANIETRKLIDSESEYKFVTEDEIAKNFYWWLDENGLGNGLNENDGYSTIVDGKIKPVINGSTRPITINVAGKNFATFDMLFLKQLPWWQKLIKIRQRVLDPAILVVDWKNDTSLPNLKQCKERTGIEGIVTHNALEDAWDVIEVMRKFY